MDATFWLALIGCLTGVLSLGLYFVEIYSYRPVISTKVITHCFQLQKQSSYGDIVAIESIKTKEDAINLINNPAIPDIMLVITVKLLINNKGNKKATINNISYKTPFTIESFKNYKYSQSGVPYSEDILIPLDVGKVFLMSSI